MSAPTRVYVADDHPLYRGGLTRIIDRAAELDLVGEADNGRTALDEIRELEPDVAVVDLEMPGLDGLGVLEALARDGKVKVLILSGYFDSDIVYRAVEAGAAGFLSKDEDELAICNAVRAIARGETILGLKIQAAIAEGVRTRAPNASGPVLSDREREVLRLTASGMSSIDVGRALHVSPATVKTHLQRIYGKLGVSDRAAAVAEAMRVGLLD